MVSIIKVFLKIIIFTVINFVISNLICQLKCEENTSVGHISVFKYLEIEQKYEMLYDYQWDSRPPHVNQ